jgi:hypothetical protein
MKRLFTRGAFSILNTYKDENMKRQDYHKTYYYRENMKRQDYHPRAPDYLST